MAPQEVIVRRETAAEERERRRAEIAKDNQDKCDLVDAAFGADRELGVFAEIFGNTEDTK